jgi:hypothetical protein
MNEFFMTLAVTVVYGSVLEWTIHKIIMHSPRFTVAFRRHTLEHHGDRRAPGHYYAKSEDEKSYHLFETSYMPVVFLLNSPYYALFYWAWGWPAAIAAVVGTAGYIVTYEILHWAMHVRHKFLFRDHAWFRFLSEHHRRHHRRAKVNYNVVCPLADLLFGTFSFEKLKPEPEDQV